MYEFAKTVFHRTPFSRIYRNYLFRKELQEWIVSGKPVPPPHIVKKQTIQDYAKQFKIANFVETGTYQGDMVDAVKDDFEIIYSIELGQELCKQAQKRFARQRHITILQGDSGQVLESVVTQIQTPALFWLDGHYSAGITAKGNRNTPINRELSCIFNHPLAHKHIVLIDDARCFTGEDDYPTIQALSETAKSFGFDQFEVKDDIIRILTPAKTSS